MGTCKALTDEWLGKLILPLHRLELSYCPHAADSKGLVKYLRQNLIGFAKSHPTIEFVVQPKSGKRPGVQGYYLNGATRYVGLKNADTEEVEKQILLLRDWTGEKPGRFREKVISTSPAVRPIWDPWHATKLSPLDASEALWRKERKQAQMAAALKRRTEKEQQLAPYRDAA